MTQITKMNDYVNKKMTYLKIQKIVNYRTKHSKRDINSNIQIQTKNWKMYTNNFFKQNIIKKIVKIILIVSFYAFFYFKIIIYIFSSSFTFSKKIRFQSSKKKSKIEFTIDENVDVNSFQSSHRFYDFERIFTS